jgi:hypothetical protein
MAAMRSAIATPHVAGWALLIPGMGLEQDELKRANLSCHSASLGAPAQRLTTLN